MSYFGPPGSGIAFGNGDGTLQTAGTSGSVTPAQLLYVATGGASTAFTAHGASAPSIFNNSTVLINEEATTTTITPTVTVTPSTSSITTSQALTVTVAVSGGTGNPTPTGSVTLSSGSYASAATALASGTAMITVPAGSL